MTPGQGDEWGDSARTQVVTAGLLVGLLVLVGGGLIALLSACVPGDTAGGFCPENGRLATTLELVALAIGTVSPIAGAIVASKRANPVWLVGGLAVAAAMLGCLVLMAYGQNSLVA